MLKAHTLHLDVLLIPAAGHAERELGFATTSELRRATSAGALSAVEPPERVSEQCDGRPVTAGRGSAVGCLEETLFCRQDSLREVPHRNLYPRGHQRASRRMVGRASGPGAPRHPRDGARPAGIPQAQETPGQPGVFCRGSDRHRSGDLSIFSLRRRRGFSGDGIDSPINPRHSVAM